LLCLLFSLEEALKDAAKSRARADRANQQLCDYEKDNGLQSRKLKGLEHDRENEKGFLTHLQTALIDARAVSLMLYLVVYYNV